MEQIFKTWKKATYFKGTFELHDNSDYATPIKFPTVFVAYSPGIHSGNWRSCTAINTPEYVINNCFDTIGHNKYDEMFTLWNYCKQLSNITWGNIRNNKANVLSLLSSANNQLFKLVELK